jgi:esterase FrsA
MRRYKRYRVFTWTILIMLVVTACAKKSPDESYRRVDQTLINKWVWLGADAVKIETAMDNMKAAISPRRNQGQYDTVLDYGRGHWVFEFEELGDGAMSAGVMFENAGESEAARDAFLEAAVYYQIGKFPYTHGSDYEHYVIAYQKSMAAYERAGRYFPSPLEIVETIFKDGTIRGYLHIPAETHESPFPLVIASGGIDVFKTENYPLTREMNERGIAVLLLDLPGVGESDFVPADPNHDQVYSDMLTLLEDDARIDVLRSAVFATSWGGNASARIAFNDERFIAAVSACGPVHETLSPPMWAVRNLPSFLVQSLFVSSIPEVRLDTVADRVGLQLPLAPEDYVVFAEAISRFSLVNQGLISETNKAKVPLLVINTTDDPVAPPSDMELLAASAETSEVIYLGEGGHCGERSEMMAKVYPWLESYLLAEGG